MIGVGSETRAANPSRTLDAEPHPGLLSVAGTEVLPGGAGRLYNPDVSAPTSAIEGHRHRACRAAQSDVSHLMHHLPGVGGA